MRVLSRLFNHTQFLYDIAVTKVVPSIRFSNRVTAVNLPTCGEFELGTHKINNSRKTFVHDSQVLQRNPPFIIW